MDDNQEPINETKEAKIELIYYLNNDKKEEGNLNFNHDKKIISYNDIIERFFSFLIEKEPKENSDLNFDEIKEDNIIYNSIRYFNGYGWILLNQDDVIILDEDLSLNNLKIMIYAATIGESTKKIKNKYDNIDEEIKKIYEDINEEKKNYLPPEAPLNLVVLTANPLMYGTKELRTMNDFNKITSKIYNCFDEEDYLKYTRFWPLTFKTLKNVITDEEKIPVILHLICKSTYVIPEQKKENILSENS